MLLSAPRTLAGASNHVSACRRECCLRIARSFILLQKKNSLWGISRLGAIDVCGKITREETASPICHPSELLQGLQPERLKFSNSFTFLLFLLLLLPLIILLLQPYFFFPPSLQSRHSWPLSCFSHVPTSGPLHKLVSLLSNDLLSDDRMAQILHFQRPSLNPANTSHDFSSLGRQNPHRPLPPT